MAGTLYCQGFQQDAVVKGSHPDALTLLKTPDIKGFSVSRFSTLS